MRLKRINGSWGHHYKLDGQYVPGVTTVLGTLDKPWMKPWVSGLIADYVVDHRAWLVEAPDDASIRSVLKGVPNNVRNEALLRGTDLHKHAEVLQTTGIVNLDQHDPQLPLVEAVARFLADWEIEAVAVEIPVCSTVHKWAGTTDLIARSAPLAAHYGLPIDALFMLDYKTNKKAIYPESGIQVAAYAAADLCHIGGQERPMLPVAACGLIRVTEAGAELVRVERSRQADLYRLFTAALHIWRATDKKRGWVDTVLSDPAMTPADLTYQLGAER